MKWQEVLDNWQKGNYPNLNKNKKNPYFWRTSVNNSNKNLVFKQEFVESKDLISQKQDLKTFSKYFEEGEKYVVSFFNLSKDTKLVVPIPRKNKNFTNIFYFMNNASETQKREFWKKVAKEARSMLKENENIWISTHGLGVNYLHVRICNKPKYYGNSTLI